VGQNAIEGVEEANPLVHNGLKVLPSVTRVFSAVRHLYVYFQALRRDAEATQPLVAHAAFLRDGEKVREGTRDEAGGRDRGALGDGEGRAGVLLPCRWQGSRRGSTRCR